MRDYGKVHTSVWASKSFRDLTEDGRTLAMYLLTCPHGTIAGVFRLPDGYACEDLQWGSERVQKGFQELLLNGFANRCETTKWVWIVKHFEWNKPENPNQCKAAQKIALQIPDGCDWKLDFMRDCGPFFGLELSTDKNPLATVQKPFLNQEQYQEQKQEQNKKTEGAAAPNVPGLSSDAGEGRDVSHDVDKPSGQPPGGEPPVADAKSLGLRELVAEGVDRQHAKDWLAVRRAKRAPLTSTAWEEVKTEAVKAGITPAEAVRISATNSWQGFRASWLDKARGVVPIGQIAGGVREGADQRSYGTGGRL